MLTDSVMDPLNSNHQTSPNTDEAPLSGLKFLISYLKKNNNAFVCMIIIFKFANVYLTFCYIFAQGCKYISCK